MRHKKEEDVEEEEKTIGMSVFTRTMETMTICFLGEKSRYGLLHTEQSYLLSYNVRISVLEKGTWRPQTHLLIAHIKQLGPWKSTC